MNVCVGSVVLFVCIFSVQFMFNVGSIICIQCKKWFQFNNIILYDYVPWCKVSIWILFGIIKTKYRTDQLRTFRIQMVFVWQMESLKIWWCVFFAFLHQAISKPFLHKIITSFDRLILTSNQQPRWNHSNSNNAIIEVIRKEWGCRLIFNIELHIN